MGVKIDMFWFETGSGFEELGSTLPTYLSPPPPSPLGNKAKFALVIFKLNTLNIQLSQRQLTATCSAIYSSLRTSLALGRLAGVLSNILEQETSKISLAVIAVHAYQRNIIQQVQQHSWTRLHRKDTNYQYNAFRTKLNPLYNTLDLSSKIVYRLTKYQQPYKYTSFFQ